MSYELCVVGVGYVGLPLIVAFDKKFDKVIGFDVSEKKIENLKNGIDITNEFSEKELKQTKIDFTTDPSKIKECNFIIVAVPTPISKDKIPVLSYVESAAEIIGKNLKKDSIIVFESTVYPGVTEDICVPILEKESGMKCGIDFKIGYSPERTNPGDKEHPVTKITKIVSGMDKESLGKIAEVYETIIEAGVYRAPDIKTAEAAKVIENIQRDLNIALVNELSLIFERMGIDTRKVLEAAGTKWNFHKYSPGLVGGHCIGVDPYYLTYKAKHLGYRPQVILAGREINESMSKYLNNLVLNALIHLKKQIIDSKVLIMGLTFKENVPDTRNSKIRDVIYYLQKYSMQVIGYDPLLTEEAIKGFGIEPYKQGEKFDCVIVASPHDVFKDITLDKLKGLMTDRPILIDIKSFYDQEEALKKGFYYKTF